jgi:hypothetical protein
MLQLFHLSVAKVDLDVGLTYVVIVSSEYCKSRSGCRVVERGRES